MKKNLNAKSAPPWLATWWSLVLLAVPVRQAGPVQVRDAADIPGAQSRAAAG